jgi:hypothetical protein
MTSMNTGLRLFLCLVRAIDSFDALSHSEAEQRLNMID